MRSHYGRDLERVKLINVNNYSSQLNVCLINPCRGRGLGSHLSPHLHLRPFPRVHNSPIIIFRARAQAGPSCNHCHAVMTHDPLCDQVLRRDLWCQCLLSSSQISIFPPAPSRVTSNRVKICILCSMAQLLTNDKAA